LGRLKPLHVRVDVDEHEGWRVRAGARAVGQVRGNAALEAPLAFVRFEPVVVPKRSLTGDSTERVDTRVLQVIYRVEDENLPLFVGQQLDVFIEAPPAPERPDA
jgi:HlyD family secretion protein